jgi:hypothetical protein
VTHGARCTLAIHPDPACVLQWRSTASERVRHPEGEPARACEPRARTDMQTGFSTRPRNSTGGGVSLTQRDAAERVGMAGPGRWTTATSSGWRNDRALSLTVIPDVMEGRRPRQP